jgi:radical SAM superfamily enzyme YgiQ (UPF0313 family)
MTTDVVLADLTHTGLGVPANNNPLAVGYLAAYARQQLGNAITPRLFKYPHRLSAYLAAERPRLVCFTNYMWNGRLSAAYAARIKRRAPQTVIVMGGPNYPVNAAEQQAFMASHPEIDFYVDGEGELPLVALFEALDAAGFDAARLRRERTMVAGVHYIVDGEFVGPPAAARILDLDGTLPSPYTSGLLDEFFDERLTPMVQTARGCPYSCTFCHDGIAYMNKTRAFSLDRVRAELEYIERRVKTATLQLADLNWGMLPGDLETARAIAAIRERSGWPRNVMVATAKNQKDRIVDMAHVLGDALQVGAAVQSTDPEVLRNIKRTNISLDAIVRMTKGATGNHTGSFSEIILALPGDTIEKHVQSVFDMLDAGIQDLRLFQFILLPGTEGSDHPSRQRFQYRTGFRALARCFGRYDMYGEEVAVFERQEVCLGNSTMSARDYVACRAFDLTVAIFNNGGVVREFFRLAEANGVPRSFVLGRILSGVATKTGPLRQFYDDFRKAENRNFFASAEELDEFLNRPGMIDRYLQGEFGENHVYRARSTALLRLFPVIARIARDAVAGELADRGRLDATLTCYLDELLEVSIARKSAVSQLDREIEMIVHFDFAALQRVDYLADPHLAYRPDGRRVKIRHTDAQRTDLRKYFAQYGDDIEGFGQFLQRNDSHLSAVLYRAVDYLEPFDGIDLPALQTPEPEGFAAASSRLSTGRSLQGLAASVIWWATLLN